MLSQIEASVNSGIGFMKFEFFHFDVDRKLGTNLQRTPSFIDVRFLQPAPSAPIDVRFPQPTAQIDRDTSIPLTIRRRGLYHSVVPRQEMSKFTNGNCILVATVALTKRRELYRSVVFRHNTSKFTKANRKAVPATAVTRSSRRRSATTRAPICMFFTHPTV